MKRGPKPKSFPTERDLTWITLYREGKTLAEIGAMYGLTRERVRQRLAKNGIRSPEGGAAIRAENRAAALKVKREHRCLSRYGLTTAELKATPAKLRNAFIQQRRSAATRGVGWTLTLAEWLQIWRESGKLEQRGRGRNAYCMARKDDRGIYSPTNVYITTCAENGADYQRSVKAGRKPRAKAAVGVYCLYPGTAKPWIAQIGQRKLGYYATAAEAIAARAAAEGQKNFSPRKLGGFCRPGFQSERKRKLEQSEQVTSPCQTFGKAA